MFVIRKPFKKDVYFSLISVVVIYVLVAAASSGGNTFSVALTTFLHYFLSYKRAMIHGQSKKKRHKSLVFLMSTTLHSFFLQVGFFEDATVDMASAFVSFVIHI